MSKVTETDIRMRNLSQVVMAHMDYEQETRREYYNRKIKYGNLKK